MLMYNTKICHFMCWLICLNDMRLKAGCMRSV